MIPPTQKQKPLIYSPAQPIDPIPNPKMPSLKTTILAAATMLLSAVRADYIIEPDSVSLTLRSTLALTSHRTGPDRTVPYHTVL